MKLPSSRSLALALTFGASSLFAAAGAAHAQTGTPRDPYVITAAPYIINKAGYYILGNNLNSSQTSGNIIEIQANNVTLDLNGFYIAGPAGNTNQSTYGINAYEKSNITIKNGTVAFCAEGIALSGNGLPNTNSVGHQVDNMRITYCYVFGVAIAYSPASRVTNCQVSQIGLSTSPNPTYGIVVSGSGAVVQNNVVSSVIANYDLAYGIANKGVQGPDCIMRQNSISSANYGVYGGKYQDNLTINCAMPYSGGIDAGGNN